jgi:hypothetical protein
MFLTAATTLFPRVRRTLATKEVTRATEVVVSLGRKAKVRLTRTLTIRGRTEAMARRDPALRSIAQFLNPPERPVCAWPL